MKTREEQIKALEETISKILDAEGGEGKPDFNLDTLIDRVEMAMRMAIPGIRFTIKVSYLRE